MQVPLNREIVVTFCSSNDHPEPSLDGKPPLTRQAHHLLMVNRDARMLRCVGDEPVTVTRKLSTYRLNLFHQIQF